MHFWTVHTYSTTSPNTVNELGYVSGFVNTVLGLNNKNSQRNLNYISTIRHEIDDSFKREKEARVYKLPNFRMIPKKVYQMFERLSL
jgi:hypothetical protein